MRFLKFEKSGEIRVFLVSSDRHACFWSKNRCWLAACAVWVKGARKICEKRVQKVAENYRNLTKITKSARFFAKKNRNLQDLYFNILLNCAK
jgi:hypothetical protein